MKFGSDRDMEGGTTKASSEGLFGLRFAPDFAKKMKPFSSDKKKKRRRLTPVSSESPQLSQGYSKCGSKMTLTLIFFFFNFSPTYKPRVNKSL